MRKLIVLVIILMLCGCQVTSEAPPAPSAPSGMSTTMDETHFDGIVVARIFRTVDCDTNTLCYWGDYMQCLPMSDEVIQRMCK